METIRDCKNRLVCKGDPHTGFVESLYKGCKTQTVLSIGGSFIIERDNVVTTVTRINTAAFKVDSQLNAA